MYIHVCVHLGFLRDYTKELNEHAGGCSAGGNNEVGIELATGGKKLQRKTTKKVQSIMGHISVTIGPMDLPTGPKDGPLAWRRPGGANGGQKSTRCRI